MQRARAAIDGFQLSAVVGPAVGGLLFAIQPELVYVVGDRARVRRARLVLALRSGREPAAEAAVGLDERARGSSSHPAHERPARRDLARSLRRAVRRSRRAAADLREGHPRGRADRSRSPARRARVGALLTASSIARCPIRREAGPMLFAVVAGFGVSHGRLRALALDVALDARARCRRRRSTW